MERNHDRPPRRNLEEPTRLQEPQDEPGDEPDRVYESVIEQLAEEQEE